MAKQTGMQLSGTGIAVLNRLGRIGRGTTPGAIKLSDQALEKRIRFHGLTESDLGVIASWMDVCKQTTDPLVDIFYAHILRTPDTKKILEQYSSIERQRPRLTRYVLTMFAGRIDDEYIEYRRRVGVAHDDIDLDANWYVAMYEQIRHVLSEAVRKSGASGAELTTFNAAFGRLIQVDIALVIEALTEARRQKIERLNVEAGAALERMAARDLTARITGEHQGKFAVIKNALNTATEHLDDSLTQVALGANQVSRAAGQISGTAQSLAQMASEQASSLEEISSSLQEMSSMTKQNASSAGHARTLADGAQSSAEQCMLSMRRLSEAINRIKESSGATAKIVKTIDDLAFQTNLLALNAAVEAARAGDEGKGFAVVAAEVRNLAIRSAEAAKNTASLIEGSVKNGEAGVLINAEVVKNLEAINEQIRKVSGVMSEIANGSSQQSEGIHQINIAVEQMNQVTQQVAASSEESASAAEELSSQSAEMTDMVGSFTLSNLGNLAGDSGRLAAGGSRQPGPKAAYQRSGHAKVMAR